MFVAYLLHFDCSLVVRRIPMAKVMPQISEKGARLIFLNDMSPSSCKKNSEKKNWMLLNAREDK